MSRSCKNLIRKKQAFDRHPSIRQQGSVEVSHAKLERDLPRIKEIPNATSRKGHQNGLARMYNKINVIQGETEDAIDYIYMFHQKLAKVWGTDYSILVYAFTKEIRYDDQDLIEHIYLNNPKIICQLFGRCKEQMEK